MARRKRPTKGKEPAPGGEASELAPFAAQEMAQEETQVFTGSLSLHELFQRQVRQTLDQSDLDEDAKQAVLVAMNCPCCGAGAMNYTVPLKRRK